MAAVRAIRVDELEHTPRFWDDVDTMRRRASLRRNRRAILARVPYRPASDVSKRVADELKAARIRHGFTWTDVEEHAGIAHSTMMRMLSGETDIPISRLLLICAAAGISASQIIEDAIRHMPEGYLQDRLSAARP